MTRIAVFFVGKEKEKKQERGRWTGRTIVPTVLCELLCVLTSSPPSRRLPQSFESSLLVFGMAAAVNGNHEFDVHFGSSFAPPPGQEPDAFFSFRCAFSPPSPLPARSQPREHQLTPHRPPPRRPKAGLARLVPPRHPLRQPHHAGRVLRLVPIHADWRSETGQRALVLGECRRSKGGRVCSCVGRGAAGERLSPILRRDSRGDFRGFGFGWMGCLGGGRLFGGGGERVRGGFGGGGVRGGGPSGGEGDLLAVLGWREVRWACLAASSVEGARHPRCG